MVGNGEKMPLIHTFSRSALRVRGKWMSYSESASKTVATNIKFARKKILSKSAPVLPLCCFSQDFLLGSPRDRILAKNFFSAIRCSPIQFLMLIPNMTFIFLGHEWLIEKTGVWGAFSLRCSPGRSKISVSQWQMTMERNLAHLCTPHWLPVKMKGEWRSYLVTLISWLGFSQLAHLTMVTFYWPRLFSTTLHANSVENEIPNSVFDAELEYDVIFWRWDGITGEKWRTRRENHFS